MTRAEIAKRYYDKNRERILAERKDPAYRERDKVRRRARAASNPDAKEKARARCKAYYWANVEAERARGREKREKDLEGRKAYNAEYLPKYRERNHERLKGVTKRWRDANPDVLRTLHNKRRAREAGATGHHTEADVRTQILRQRGKCYWCGTMLGKKRKDYHADHVWPLILGGTNGPENIVVACPRCNCSKRHKTPAEFAGRLL
jgi:5-methylcytosine-specific restriction endonuclease McrA